MRTEPTGDDHAEVRFHPPVLLAVLVLIGYLLHRYLPVPLPFEGIPRGIGRGVVLAGILLVVWCSIVMRRRQTSVPTHTPTTAIVDGGPYAMSRNPIYLAMVIILLGGSLASGSAWFAVLILAFVPLMQWGVISREEAYLTRKFPEEYGAYRSRVRRWL